MSREGGVLGAGEGKLVASGNGLYDNTTLLDTQFSQSLDRPIHQCLDDDLVPSRVHNADT